MFSCLFCLLLTLSPLSVRSLPTEQTDNRKPTVTLHLPVGIPSESVQLYYSMRGPFGGQTVAISPEPNQSDFVIEAVSDDEPATEVRIIAYVPGCKIRAFSLQIKADSTYEEKYECERLPLIKFSGKIVPAGAVHSSGSYVVIHYVAAWATAYFGYMDGPLPKFSLATVYPDEQGWFEVELPDFSGEPQDHSARKFAALEFQLIDPSDAQGVPRGLGPHTEEFREFPHYLKILPAYPNGLELTWWGIE